MITVRQASKIMDRVDHIAARLSDTERAQLVKSALTLGEIRALTLDRAYWAKAIQVLEDLAPSLAQELTQLIDTVEDIHHRLPELRPRNGNPT